jgi:RHS repeat-associated protein
MQRQRQKAVGGMKTNFYYAGFQRLADYDGTTNALQDRYVYGAGLDEILIKVSSAGVKTYYHANHQGSVIATTDSGGAVVNRYKYGPFGESTALSGTTHGYTGQRIDAETGNYYYKLRYYSPKLGRFLQPDPIGMAGGMNLYGYVGNSPLLTGDALGLAADSDGGALGSSDNGNLFGVGYSGSDLGPVQLSPALPNYMKESVSSIFPDYYVQGFESLGGLQLAGNNADFQDYLNKRYPNGLTQTFIDAILAMAVRESGDMFRNIVAEFLEDKKAGSSVFKEVQFVTDRGNPRADIVYYSGIDDTWHVVEVKTSRNGNYIYTKPQQYGYPEIEAGNWRLDVNGPVRSLMAKQLFSAGFPRGNVPLKVDHYHVNLRSLELAIKWYDPSHPYI